MTRYSGVIGFALDDVETSPGVYKQAYSEHKVVGTELGQDFNIQNETTINDTITLSTRISIVADRYSFEHIDRIKYMTYQGQTWKVNSATPNRPNIILSLGKIFTRSKGSVVI